MYAQRKNATTERKWFDIRPGWPQLGQATLSYCTGNVWLPLKLDSSKLTSATVTHGVCCMPLPRVLSTSDNGSPRESFGALSVGLMWVVLEKKWKKEIKRE
jgi:hypothetical protein